MYQSSYKITPSLFKKYSPRYAHNEILSRAKLFNIVEHEKIVSIIDAIVNDDPIYDPQLAGHFYEIILLDAVVTDYLSPKHGLESTNIARSPNQPYVDFVTFKNNKPSVLYQVKWSLNDEDALHLVQGAWGTLHSCSQFNNAKPFIVVNHSVGGRLVADLKKSVKVVLGSQLYEWLDKRFHREIVPALKEATKVASVVVYQGEKKLNLNPIQREHRQATDKALLKGGAASWHLCPAYGKTIIGLDVLHEVLKGQKKNELAVVGVPRLSLAGQWRKKARKYKEFNDVGIEIFGTYERKKDTPLDKEIDDLKTDKDSDEQWDRHGTTNVNEILNSLATFKKKIIISTYQSLSKLVEKRNRKYKIRFIIADEAHRSSPVFKLKGKNLWSNLKKTDNTKLIIASATLPPQLSKRIGVKEPTCSLNLDQALNERRYSKYLTKGKQARLCGMWGLLRLAHKNDGDKDIYNFLVKRLPRFVRAKNKWKRNHSVKVLIFCFSITEAINVRNILRTGGRKEKRTTKIKKDIAYAVSSSRRTSDDENKSAQKHLRDSITLFEKSKSSVIFLTNAEILTEGIDLPDCSAVAILSRRSYAPMTQIMGRAVRYAPGKKCGVTAFYGICSDKAKVEKGIEKYRSYMEDVLGSSFYFDQVIQGKGGVRELPSGNRDTRTVLDETGPLPKGNPTEQISYVVKKRKKEFGITKKIEPAAISTIRKKRKIIEYIKRYKRPPPGGHELNNSCRDYRHEDPDFKRQTDELLEKLGVLLKDEAAEQKKAELLIYLQKKGKPKLDTPMYKDYIRYRGSDDDFKIRSNEILKKRGELPKFENKHETKMQLLKYLDEEGENPPTDTPLYRFLVAYRKKDKDIKRVIKEKKILFKREKAQEKVIQGLSYLKETGRFPVSDSEIGRAFYRRMSSDENFKKKAYEIRRQHKNPVQFERTKLNQEDFLKFIKKTGEKPTAKNHPQGKLFNEYMRKYPIFRDKALKAFESKNVIFRTKEERVQKKQNEIIAYSREFGIYPPPGTTLGIACSIYRHREALYHEFNRKLDIEVDKASKRVKNLLIKLMENSGTYIPQKHRYYKSYYNFMKYDPWFKFTVDFLFIPIRIQKFSTLKDLMEAVRAKRINNIYNYRKACKENKRFPVHPEEKYKDWKDWTYLFTGKEKKEKYASYKEARIAARKLKIKGGRREYRKRYKENPRLPFHPKELYKKDWKGWDDFLGKTKVR